MKLFILKCIDTCTQVDGSGEIIRLEPQCPWVEHLFALEYKLTISPNIKFVLYQEKESEKWRVQVSWQITVGMPDAIGLGQGCTYTGIDIGIGAYTNGIGTV